MTRPRIEAFLEEKIGLDANSIGSETIAKAVRRLMEAEGILEIEEYIRLINISKSHWDELVESVVVPETWFFRNNASFAYLGKYVRTEWLPANRECSLRILSIPCASGEEPYSIAMALLDTGIPRERIVIDAVDISNRALSRAREGKYGRESFRGKDLSFRDRFFSDANGQRDSSLVWSINRSVASLVRFMRGNLLDNHLLYLEEPYDIVFCRNLLIYLSEGAKRRALKNLDRLLNRDGILFVGHVERSLVDMPGFDWIRQSGVFACKRDDKVPEKEAPLERPKAHVVKEPKQAVNRFKPRKVCVVNKKPPVFGEKKGLEKRAPMKPRPRERPPGQKRSPLLDEAQRLADQGELAMAREICERFLKENAFNTQAHFLMGVICHASDEEERAEMYFNKTIYLDPNHHEALSHLAFIMEHRGERPKAIQLRERVNRILQRENGL